MKIPSSEVDEPREADKQSSGADRSCTNGSGAEAENIERGSQGGGMVDDVLAAEVRPKVFSFLIAFVLYTLRGVGAR